MIKGVGASVYSIKERERTGMYTLLQPNGCMIAHRVSFFCFRKEWLADSFLSLPIHCNLPIYSRDSYASISGGFSSPTKHKEGASIHYRYLNCETMHGKKTVGISLGEMRNSSQKERG